jgi:hypothetical protein
MIDKSDYERIIKKISSEISEEDKGYKSMASSVGEKTGKVKKYMKSDRFKGIVKSVKSRAKKADNPDAYLAATERKILKGHFSK